MIQLGTTGSTGSTGTIRTTGTTATTGTTGAATTGSAAQQQQKNVASSGNKSVGIIVGSVFGAIAFVALVSIEFCFTLQIIGVFFIIRRKQQHRELGEYEMPDTEQLKGITIKTKLGTGNFGEVYHGDWNGAEVALKRLKSAEDLEEFVKEIRILR